MNSDRASPGLSDTSSDTPGEHDIEIDDFPRTGGPTSNPSTLEALSMGSAAGHSTFFGTGPAPKRRLPGGLTVTGVSRDPKSRRKDVRGGGGGSGWETGAGAGRGQRDDLVDSQLVDKLRLRECMYFLAFLQPHLLVRSMATDHAYRV